MSTEVMYTLEEDKQEAQKQLGCMNGIFQLFDRRNYLLGNRHKKLPQGQSVTCNKFNNASDKFKEYQGPNKVVKEKQKDSVESSRSSFSSSCSSLECGKPVQTEPPSSPISNKKHDLWGPQADIRDVVMDSMTRKPRVVLVKTVAKDEQKGPKMTHVDSPRPLHQHLKPVTYERRDQNLVKFEETSIPSLRGVKDIKNTSRFSYDDLESPYKLKSYASIKDRPRHSLDSKQSSIKHNTNAVDQIQTHERGGNKRLPSSVVARLMGLDVLNYEALNIKALKVNTFTRIPVESAPWKQEVKQPVNNKVEHRPDRAFQSVYGQEGLTKVEFKTSGDGLRAVNSQESLQKVKKVNARHQRSKIRKQSNSHLTISNSKTRDRSSRDTCHIRNLSEQSDTVSIHSEKKNKFPESLMGYKPMVEQPSHVSVLDAFYTEETPSPINKKSYSYKDDEDPCFDVQEWSQAGTADLVNNTEPNPLTSRSNNIKSKHINQLVHQTESSNSISEGMNKAHIYIKEMLSTSSFLKNLDFATTIVPLHPKGSLINPKLFNILEKTKNRASKSEKIKRKMVCLEINNLHTNKTSDRYDEIINIITEDVNNKSEEWDDYCNEVPGLVFDIELFVFNNLVTEIMNVAVSGYGLLKH